MLPGSHGRECRWVAGGHTASAFFPLAPSLREGIAFLVVQGHLPGTCHCYTQYLVDMSKLFQAGRGAEKQQDLARGTR